MQVKLVNFLTGPAAVGTTIPITGVGFVPQIILFFGSGDTGAVNAVARGTQLIHFGMAVSPSDRRACATACPDAVDPTTSTSISCRHTNINCVTVMNNGGGTDGELDLQSLDSDGFTLVVTKQ